MLQSSNSEKMGSTYFLGKFWLLGFRLDQFFTLISKFHCLKHDLSEALPS